MFKVGKLACAEPSQSPLHKFPRLRPTEPRCLPGIERLHPQTRASGAELPQAGQLLRIGRARRDLNRDGNVARRVAQDQRGSGQKTLQARQIENARRASTDGHSRKSCAVERRSNSLRLPLQRVEILCHEVFLGTAETEQITIRTASLAEGHVQVEKQLSAVFGSPQIAQRNGPH